MCIDAVPSDFLQGSLWSTHTSHTHFHTLSPCGPSEKKAGVPLGNASELLLNGIQCGALIFGPHKGVGPHTVSGILAIGPPEVAIASK